MQMFHKVNKRQALSSPLQIFSGIYHRFVCLIEVWSVERITQKFYWALFIHAIKTDSNKHVVWSGNFYRNVVEAYCFIAPCKGNIFIVDFVTYKMNAAPLTEVSIFNEHVARRVVKLFMWSGHVMLWLRNFGLRSIRLASYFWTEYYIYNRLHVWLGW